MTISAGASGLIRDASPPRLLDGLAHGREVDDAGHPGEVLHDHAGRRELDLVAGLGVRVPGCEPADVVGGDVGAVLGPQQVLEQDLEAVGQRLDVDPLAGHRVEAEDLVGLAVHVQRALGTKAVLTRHQPSPRDVSGSLPPILPTLPGAPVVRVHAGSRPRTVLMSRYTTSSENGKRVRGLGPAGRRMGPGDPVLGVAPSPGSAHDLATGAARRGGAEQRRVRRRGRVRRGAGGRTVLRHRRGRGERRRRGEDRPVHDRHPAGPRAVRRRGRGRRTHVDDARGARDRRRLRSAGRLLLLGRGCRRLPRGHQQRRRHQGVPQRPQRLAVAGRPAQQHLPPQRARLLGGGLRRLRLPRRLRVRRVQRRCHRGLLRGQHLGQRGRGPAARPSPTTPAW